jgi:hypothetical protein
MASLFTFNFSQNLISPEIAKKYNAFLKKNKYPYANIVDLINSGVSEFGFPGFRADVFRSDFFKKASSHSYQYMDRPLEISLQKIDGNLTQFALIENAHTNYYKVGEKNMPIGNCYFQRVDIRGFVTWQVEFLNCVMEEVELPEVDFTHTDTDKETFSVTVHWNDLKITPFP